MLHVNSQVDLNLAASEHSVNPLFGLDIALGSQPNSEYKNKHESVTVKSWETTNLLKKYYWEDLDFTSAFWPLPCPFSNITTISLSSTRRAVVSFQYIAW